MEELFAVSKGKVEAMKAAKLLNKCSYHENKQPRGASATGLFQFANLITLRI